ncbi:MAG: hypothetical protein R2688_08570 [Fimbriimonadaceae bacterium]
MELTEQDVRVFDSAGTVLLTLPLTDIADARNEPLVSGGRLIVDTKSGEEITVCSYSLRHSTEFSDMARAIEHLAKEGEFLGQPL